MVRSLNTRSGSTARSADNACPESLTPRHWLYFSLITLVLLSDGMDVTIVAHVFPTLIKSWGVSVGGGIAFVVAVGFLAMGLGAVVAGGMADRWGRKRVLIGSVVVFGRGHRPGRNIWRLHGIRRLANPGLPGDGRCHGIRERPAGRPDSRTAARGIDRDGLRRSGFGDNVRCGSRRRLDTHLGVAPAARGGRLDPLGSDRCACRRRSRISRVPLGQAPGGRCSVDGRTWC